MCGRNLDAHMREQGSGFRGPGFEFFPVRVGFDVTDHEVAEVAVFVGEDVAQPIFIVDDLLRELDGSIVSIFGSCFRWVCDVLGTYGFAFPIGAAGSGIQGFAPDELYASGGGG